MRVRQLLETKGRCVHTVTPDTPVAEAMDTLITNRISCLPVVTGSKAVVGILSDKDIFAYINRNPTGFRETPIGEIMTTEVIIGLTGDDLNYIAGLMTVNRIRHIPIMEANKLVGLVSVGDIVKAQMTHMEIENRYLRQYIEGAYPC